MFTQKQINELDAPLAASKVKQRKQGGRDVSYVEGWHCIQEANRIFGFDKWTRETVDIRCVSERERTIGGGKAEGFAVSYIARVRITVDGVVREGCGAGHGIDRDLGQAHESAIKEAETDAMKRALMTFGNTFGLALYDKEQANVADDSRCSFIAQCAETINAFTDAHKLVDWWNSDDQKSERRTVGLLRDEVESLKHKVIAKHSTLAKNMEAA